MTMIFFKIISAIVWLAAIPISFAYLADRISLLQKITLFKRLSRWVTDQLLAADRAGKDRRGEDGKPRQMSSFWMGVWGFTLPTLVFFAIFPWALDDLRLLLMMPLLIIFLMPLSSFIESLYWLRFGYTRLEGDDDGNGGSETIPPFDPPPFGGRSAPWPERRRNQRASLSSKRSRQRSKETPQRPLVPH